ncbi:hypothetical protein HDV00_012344, partial [Rhizophlyctis rosea]
MAEKRRKEADPSARPDARALRKQRVEEETRKWTPQIPGPRSMRKDRRRPTAIPIVQIPAGRRGQYLRPKPPMRKPIRRPADAVGPARGGDQVVTLPEIPEGHRRIGSIPAPARKPEDGNAGNLGSQVGVGVGVGTGSQSPVASPNDGNGSSGRRGMTPPVREERMGNTKSPVQEQEVRMDGNAKDTGSQVREERMGTGENGQQLRVDGVGNSGDQEGNEISGRRDMTPPVQEERTENMGSQSVYVGQRVAGSTVGNAVSVDHVTAPTSGVAEIAQNSGRNTPPGFRASSSADPPRPPPVQPIVEVQPQPEAQPAEPVQPVAPVANIAEMGAVPMAVDAVPLPASMIPVPPAVREREKEAIPPNLTIERGVLPGLLPAHRDRSKRRDR